VNIPNTYFLFHAENGVDCFDPYLPFFAFSSGSPQKSTTIWIYSKNGKQVAEISLPKEHSWLRGDRKSRIYSRLEENNKFYLHIIDFAD